jgi:hypothetical protein
LIKKLGSKNKLNYDKQARYVELLSGTLQHDELELSILLKKKNNFQCTQNIAVLFALTVTVTEMAK